MIAELNDEIIEILQRLLATELILEFAITQTYKWFATQATTGIEGNLANSDHSTDKKRHFLFDLLAAAACHA